MISSKHDTLHQVEAVARNIEIRPGRILIQEKEPIPFYEGSRQYPSDLPARLSEAIYRHFYCTGEAGAEQAPGQLSYEEALVFVGQLEEANCAEARFDKSWKVEHHIPGGQAVAAKGNFKRTINPGEYVFSNSLLYMPDDAKVDIWMRRQDAPADKGFYYAFGATAGDDDATMLVRFYFHLLPAGAPVLVRWLSTTFNRALVPFQFKCLHHPALYTRSDAGVLYLSKRYANYAIELLDDFMPELGPFLRASVPLFTLPLHPGIGFAESPPRSSASFGTSRCDIIAGGLAAAYEQQLPEGQRMEAILAAIRHHNLDPRCLFLNPGSHYPYSFLKKQAA